MAEEVKLTHYERRLLERVKKAGHLGYEHCPTESEPERFFLPNGRKVGPNSARGLIAKEQLRPAGDSLFNEMAQTYVPA